MMFNFLFLQHRVAMAFLAKMCKGKTMLFFSFQAPNSRLIVLVTLFPQTKKPRKNEDNALEFHDNFTTEPIFNAGKSRMGVSFEL